MYYSDCIYNTSFGNISRFLEEYNWSNALSRQKFSDHPCMRNLHLLLCTHVCSGFLHWCNRGCVYEIIVLNDKSATHVRCTFSRGAREMTISDAERIPIYVCLSWTFARALRRLRERQPFRIFFPIYICTLFLRTLNRTVAFCNRQWSNFFSIKNIRVASIIYSLVPGLKTENYSEVWL